LPFVVKGDHCVANSRISARKFLKVSGPRRRTGATNDAIVGAPYEVL
jgi:hypothetical protein